MSSLARALVRTRRAAVSPLLRQVRWHGDHMDHPGEYAMRETGGHAAWKARDWNHRAFTVGIGGPVGSGKTALVLQLCRGLRERRSIGVVTNDIFTREVRPALASARRAPHAPTVAPVAHAIATQDAEFLTRNEALPAERIRAVETGGCPHAAIREDVTSNLAACEDLTAEVSPQPEILLCESGGDNLAANFSNELADYTIYVIDVAGGDKVPRKGGPGVTQADLLVINKVDLAEAVGADLDVMASDAKRMRGDGPVVMAAVKSGLKLADIEGHILAAWHTAMHANDSGHGHEHAH